MSLLQLPRKFALQLTRSAYINSVRPPGSVAVHLLGPILPIYLFKEGKTAFCGIPPGVGLDWRIKAMLQEWGGKQRKTYRMPRASLIIGSLQCPSVDPVVIYLSTSGMSAWVVRFVVRWRQRGCRDGYRLAAIDGGDQWEWCGCGILNVEMLRSEVHVLSVPGDRLSGWAFVCCIEKSNFICLCNGNIRFDWIETA